MSLEMRTPSLSPVLGRYEDPLTDLEVTPSGLISSLRYTHCLSDM
jgi:hypothetical protein